MVGLVGFETCSFEWSMLGFASARETTAVRCVKLLFHNDWTWTLNM